MFNVKDSYSYTSIFRKSNEIVKIAAKMTAGRSDFIVLFYL